jgi:hypothetical protein
VSVDVVLACVFCWQDDASSLYPEDFALAVGDVVLFKVEKAHNPDEVVSDCFRVLELRSDRGSVDMFFQKFSPCVVTKVSVLVLYFDDIWHAALFVSNIGFVLCSPLPLMQAMTGVWLMISSSVLRNRV